ncbi:protein ELYS [Phymastichus coffea]|uniref:protein ELYS n=1 Tax=Phymastichus coffea TaxID=108790 RepID=UPI00273C0D05|nr:protein ELYS [Phymastichus coffea]XP_058805553.1 protein ELYS [Phymastichus coffea]XP_058805554.1 protein ELYS [Phymastichus coffea]
MKELEETNCEIRNVINLDIPSWSQLDNVTHYEESATTGGSKDTNLTQNFGGFLNNECRYAWLSHDRRLVVIDARCGRCISTWSFPNQITSVYSFPMESGQMPLLLVGTDNNAIRIKDSIGYLYVYDCNTSIILTTIQVPAGVEKACIVHGGAEWEEYNEKRPDTVLPGNSGLIFAALRNLQHIIIDVNRLLWQSKIQDGKMLSAKLEFVNSPPTTLNSKKKELRYLAYNLMDREIEQFMGFDRDDFESTPLFDENLCSVLLSSTKTGCLITGCLGRVIIWQSDGSIGWISPTFDENAYVTHVALLEPSDDPRPFYYLWIACQNDSSNSSAVLRMYAMLFNKKHSDKSGESSLYFNLESEPSLKFELELEQGERVHSLISVERENSRDPADYGSRRGEDSLLLIGSDERVLLFDLNRWYKEQMPRTMAECRNPNSVMASYRTAPEDSTAPRKGIVACAYASKSLREFPIKGPSSPEELFYPNSLTIEWLELSWDSLTHWLVRGVQAELLREITITGPIVLVKPTEIYHRCLVSGLVPFDSTPQDFLFDADQAEQRQMLLSICLEQRWANFLLRCVLEWSDGSAAYLYPEFLRWSVQRASELKLITDQLCVPLFDQSGITIGETEVRTLRFCAQQLECLGNVVAHVPNLEGDLERQRRALKRIATYLQVLLWFYDVGLLPESRELVEQKESDLPQIAFPVKIPYPIDKLAEFYEKRKENCQKMGGKMEQEDVLFIDQLINYECMALKAQWQREAVGEFSNREGRYPPPSLQTLLRSFLTDCYRETFDGTTDEEDIGDLVEMQSKHSITIYLLMDLAMLLQNTHSNVDQLIKYPSAFKLSPSLIKLTQAFWLLDHEDYEGFFNVITGELVSLTDIKDWHHKLAIRTLLQNNQHKLALMYLRIIKPPLTSLEEQGIIISLSVEQGLVESAFHARPSSHYNQLLTRFFQSCKAHGKLKEILLLSLDSEEEEAFVKFLKDNECEDIRLLYYLQRSRHAEAKDVFSIDTNRNSRHSIAPNKINPIALKMLGAYNDTLPAVTKKFANTLNKNDFSVPLFSSNKANSYQVLQPQSFMGNSSSITNITQGYPKPMSQCRLPAKEIYELAVYKTRETCLKAGKVNTSVNYVPFLGAPCSTIVFCTRATGNIPEQTDANCVLFPERKLINSKRSLDTINHGNIDAVDDTTDRKRRRLGSVSDTNLSKEENNAQLFRRLSMSQVCKTPLVQRKDKEFNNLTVETPHSILKIRQLLQRNSNSPGYDLNGSNEENYFLKPSVIDDVRPARQIRFSVERFSSNEDSLCSMNDSNQEKDEQENISLCNKIADGEAGTDETYYSPNASTQYSRDSSILTDSSITKYFRGPRPRPSLRRSSLLSHASSEYLSQKMASSDNSTLSVSKLDISQEKSRKTSGSPSDPSKSLLSQTVYNASILSANTSVETSPLKRPFAFESKCDVEEESEESEELSGDEEEVSTVTCDNENLLVTPVTSKVAQQTDRKQTAEASENEAENEEMETPDEDSKSEISASASQDPSQQPEISDDEEIEKLKKQSKHLELEDGECESFQSFSNSMDNSTFEPIVQCIDHPIKNFNDDANYDITDTFENRKIHGQDYSLIERSKLNPKDESINEDHDHSLTKPLFLDNRDTLKFAEPTPDITDDESVDEVPVKMPELESIIQSQNKVEDEDNEDDLKLSVSSSDDNSPDNEQLASDTLTRTNGLSSRKEEDKLPDSSPTSKTLKRKRTVSATKESSIEPSLSVPTMLIDDINKPSTPLRRSARKPSAILQPSPRRSIKSLSSSPGKICEAMEPITPSQLSDREKQNISAMREVKVSLSKALGMPNEQSNNQSSEKISSRASSRQSSREPSQDKDISQEISVKTKRSARTTQRESVNQTISTRTRARIGSTSKEVEKPAKKTKVVSVVRDGPTIFESSTDSEHLVEEPSEKKTKFKTKVTSMSKDAIVADNIDETEEAHEVEKSSKPRATRTKETSLKSVRKTRAGSVTQEKSALEKPASVRKTRASSVVQDDEVFLEKSVTVTKKPKASSVVQDDKLAINTRKTRAGCVAQDRDMSEEKLCSHDRKTRATSVVKEEEVPLGMRRTRAASVSKDTSAIENGDTMTKRATRAASVSKDTSTPEHEETFSKRPIRKRGSSVPKDAPAEPVKLYSRRRRSTSLLQEVILEESLSQLDSPMDKRNRLPRAAEEIAVSSPATNTRSRRSSIQSVPEELEEILNVPIPVRVFNKKSNSAEIHDENRSRRAASVDSKVIVPVGKRVTRSVLAKTTLIEDIIPEETTKSLVTKKQPTRRKRATSVPVEAVEETEKAKLLGKPKRGRKVSEGKNFEFSVPEETGELPDDAQGECKTPTYEFSKPAGFQKFISPIPDDEETSEMTTNLIKRINVKSERATSIRMRRPRTCFVLPKKMKNKTN